MLRFYQENYPRPQFVRPNWLDLNGSWKFRFDEAAQGEQLRWQQVFPADCREINVPFSYETARSGIGDPSHHDVVWYSRTVPIPSQAAGNRLLLHFEGVDYDAKVWVDGAFVGAHRGGYDRFTLDITECAQGKPAVTLILRAEDSLATDQPRGKQRYKQESWGCWYVQTTGIWKSVWLEWVAPHYLQSVHCTPDVSRRELRLEARTAASQRDFGAHRFSLATEIFFSGACLQRREDPLSCDMQTLSLPLPEGALHLWSPENPNLYEIRYTLLRDGEAVDSVCSYFGLRTVACENGAVTLNGKPIYLRMVLDQGYWAESGLTPPSEEALRRDIAIARRFGYNGLRKHQKIEDERFLYWCDVEGMLVWSEMAACYSFTPRAVTEFTRQWLTIVNQNRNHPCIIAWVPFNESWGIDSVKTDYPTQSFVNGIYFETKALDPTRPVITNDGWEHTISDIVTIHDYRETGAELAEHYVDEERSVLHNRSISWYGQMVFAQGYGYRGQPVILSEYGGIALKNDSGWGYGNQAADEEAFWQRFSSQNEAIHNVPYFAGFCYTQLTDVEQEVNGLVDMARNPKLSPQMEEKIKQSNESV